MLFILEFKNASYMKSTLGESPKEHGLKYLGEKNLK